MAKTSNDDIQGKADAQLTRRHLLAFLMAAPLATCVSIQRQPIKPSCGRGRSPDDCYQFQPLRVERTNRNYP